MRLFCALLLLFIRGLNGEYSVTVYLRRLDVGQGFLQNGTHCTDTWNLGDQCNLQLKLGICLDVPSNPLTPCPSPTPIDLQNVTFNANAVDFSGGGTQYGAWTNPMVFANTDPDAIYAGLSINVEIRESRGGALIDAYQYRLDDGSAPNNFLYYSHPRDPLDATMLSIAWKAAGDLPTPPPPPTTTEAPTPTYTTVTEPSTEPPTTPEPVTARDCEEVKTRTNGVYPILIGDQVQNVYCEFGTNVALTHIQSRGESQPDVDRFDIPFDDYKSPFGTPGLGGNFWLGLDQMNSLTNSNNYSLLIEVCCGGDSKAKQYYTNFKIGPGGTYNISATATLNAGLNFFDNSNAYGRDLGQRFLTYETWTVPKDDRDYCEIISAKGPGSGGWWFGNCRENLNGLYYAAADLDENCVIKNKEDPRGTGIELVTTPLAGGDLDYVSYTRARMAVYRGTATPLGLSNFCVRYV